MKPRSSISTQSSLTNSENISVESFNNDLNTSLSSVKLIRAVKRHEVLYNASLEKYNRLTTVPLWEKIYQELYPKYNDSSDSTKELVRTNIRRRWKVLRRNLVKTVKSKKFARKAVVNPLLHELEFLIPHISRTYPKKGQKKDKSIERDEELKSPFEDDDNDRTGVVNEADEIEEGSSNICDLTYANKTILKIDPSERSFGSVADPSTCESAPSENLLYPTIRMTIGADGTCIENRSARTSTTGSNEYQWGSGYCVTDLSDNGECELPIPAHRAREFDTTPKQINSIQSQRKRPRTSPGEPNHSAKIARILSDMDRNSDRPSRDEHDEDRMFLLSLVSALRNVPAGKKMLVKAEIVTAIATGQQ